MRNSQPRKYLLESVSLERVGSLKFSRSNGNILTSGVILQIMKKMTRCGRSQMLPFTCVLLFLIATAVADDPIVQIIETNPVKDLVEGKIIAEKNQDVQLTCVVENKPRDSEVQWNGIIRKNGTQSTVPISTSTRSYDAFKYAIDTPSPTSWRLRIQNAQVTDEGLYKCEVQISRQNYARAEENLVIVEKPQIADLETSSDVARSEGQSLTLKCYATGRPIPLTKWTRMAGELLPGGGREHLKPDLIIPQLKPEHAGIYQCSATNSAGFDYRNIRLTVSFPPVLTTANQAVQQAVGYVKELVCDIKGFPTPVMDDISWTRSGAALGFDNHIYIRNIPGASSRITSILVFWPVLDSDYGEYTCGAKNDKGSRSIVFQLQRSSTPTEDRTNQIRAGAAVLSASLLGTVIMVLSVCFLHQLGFH